MSIAILETFINNIYYYTAFLAEYTSMSDTPESKLPFINTPELL